MRKHILPACLALLASSVAHAQAGTQLYGVADLWAGRSATAGGGPAQRVLNSGGLTTSYWGLGGSEDIGAGTLALYAVEGYLQADTGAAGRTPGDALFARNAWVGLAGALGEIKLGRILNPLFTASAQVNPFGGSIRFAPLLAQMWSPAMGRAVAGDTSWDNMALYTSAPVADWRLQLYATAGEAAVRGIGNAGATVGFSRGAVTAVLVAQRVRVGPGLATVGESVQRSWFAGAAVPLGPVKVYGSWAVANADRPSLRSRIASAGASVPAGGGAILAAWARTRTEGPAASGTRTTTAAGYDYPLSKRTDLYAVAQRDTVRGAAGAHSLGLGMRHRY